MRVRWDEAKRQHVLQKRGIDFAQLDGLLDFPYVEDQLRDDPVPPNKSKRSMSKKQSKTVKSLTPEEIAEQAEQGIDVSEHFTGKHSAKQFVSIDFPLELLRAIDTECRQVGVSRQAWIKLACDERLRQIQSGRVGAHGVPSRRA